MCEKNFYSIIIIKILIKNRIFLLDDMQRRSYRWKIVYRWKKEWKNDREFYGEIVIVWLCFSSNKVGEMWNEWEGDFLE